MSLGKGFLKQAFLVPVSFWAPSVSVSASSVLRNPVPLFRASCAMRERDRWRGFLLTSRSQDGGYNQIFPPSVPSVPAG